MKNLTAKNYHTKFKKNFLSLKNRFLLLFTIFLLLVSLSFGWIWFFNISNIFQYIVFPISNKNIKIGLLGFSSSIFLIFFLMCFLKKENKLLLLILILLFFIILFGTVIMGILTYNAAYLLLNLTDVSLIKNIAAFVLYIATILLILFFINIFLIINFIIILRNKNAFANNNLE